MKHLQQTLQLQPALAAAGASAGGALTAVILGAAACLAAAVAPAQIQGIKTERLKQQLEISSRTWPMDIEHGLAWSGCLHSSCVCRLMHYAHETKLCKRCMKAAV